MKRSWLLGLMLVASATIGCGGVYGGYYATVPPPPVRAEAYGPAPGPGFAWVSGYYGWRGGRYEWVGGHWAHPRGQGQSGNRADGNRGAAVTISEKDAGDNTATFPWLTPRGYSPAA